MKLFRQLLVLAAAGFAAFISNAARAATFTQAEITQIFNEVRTLDASGARPSKIRETIAGTQSVKTGARSRAELMFPDQSLTRLGGNTIFSFQQGTRELELKQGTILFEVPKGAGGARIRTAAITAAITGTTGFYEYSPYAGPDGIIKFGILEGEATLFIKGRLGHFIRVGAGEMVICPANLRDFNSTDVVHFDIETFIRTCALINQMGGLPPGSMILVRRSIDDQGRLFNGSRELFVTNLFIPGGGTEVILSELNKRFTANNPLAQSPPPQTTPPKTSKQDQTQGFTQTQTQATATPGRYGPLKTITSANPYIISSGTTIITDPSITTNGVTDFGSTYRNAALDGSLSDYYFGSTSSFDSQIGFADSFSVPTQGFAAFKFLNLKITGQPVINTANGPRELALISEGTIITGAPGGIFNLDALDGLLLATVNGSITSGPELSYTHNGTGGFYLTLYARGPSSDVNFNSNVGFSGGELHLVAEHDVAVNGQISVPTFQAISGNNFTLGPSGQITASSSVGISARDVIGSGGALISTPNLSASLLNAASLTQSGNNLLINTLPISTSSLASFTLSAPSIAVPSDVSLGSTISLTLAGTINAAGSLTSGSMALLGNATVGRNVSVTNQLTIQNLSVYGSVNANVISRGFLDNTPHTLTAGSVTAPGGLVFNGFDGTLITAPRDGGIFTLTSSFVTFDLSGEVQTPIGASSFNGGNADANSGRPGGNGGTLTVNANSGLSVNVPISATSGVNSTAVTTGGAGGTVNLNSNSGQIFVASTIDVSSNDPANRRVSAAGGKINVQSGATSGTAINVTNSGALRALLNAAAPGPGGTVQLVSAGGDINFGGLAQADRGTVKMQNNGVDGVINVLSTANINADVVKVGALGNNGLLNIGGGSISANTLLKLYAGNSPTSAGTIHFTDNVSLSGGTKIIAASTVTIDSGKLVTVNGSTASVYSDHRNYVGGNFNGSGSFGNFTGLGAPTAGSTHAYAGAPGF